MVDLLTGVRPVSNVSESAPLIHISLCEHSSGHNWAQGVFVCAKVYFKSHLSGCYATASIWHPVSMATGPVLLTDASFHCSCAQHYNFITPDSNTQLFISVIKSVEHCCSLCQQTHFYSSVSNRMAAAYSTTTASGLLVLVLSFSSSVAPVGGFSLSMTVDDCYRPSWEVLFPMLQWSGQVLQTVALQLTNWSQLENISSSVFWEISQSLQLPQTLRRRRKQPSDVS